MLRLNRSVVLVATMLTLAVPGVSGATTIIFEDNFNRTDTGHLKNGWIVSRDNHWDVRIKGNRLRIRDKDDFPSITQLQLDTTGYEDIKVAFDYESFGDKTGTESTEPNDLLTLLFDAGSGWEEVQSIPLGNDGIVFSVSYDLPDSADDNPDLGTRLALTVSTNDEGVFIDNFVVTGEEIGSGETLAAPMPEPSAGLVFGVGLLIVSHRLRRRR